MRFTLAQIMVAIAVVGVALGISTRAYNFVESFSSAIVMIFAFPATATLIGFAILKVARLPSKHRLTIEWSTLIFLIVWSAQIWTPAFCRDEADRCAELARVAARAASSHPKTRAALDREVAWFTRRANRLHWRGFWLGLTLGPATRNSDQILIEYLGTLESVDKHERILQQIITAKPPMPLPTDIY